jgi:hypothetical protein
MLLSRSCSPLSPKQPSSQFHRVSWSNVLSLDNCFNDSGGNSSSAACLVPTRYTPTLTHDRLRCLKIIPFLFIPPPSCEAADTDPTPRLIKGSIIAATTGVIGNRAVPLHPLEIPVHHSNIMQTWQMDVSCRRCASCSAVEPTQGHGHLQSTP